MEPVPSLITKTYPQRGPLRQFRFADSTAFTCFRCSQTKKSKLITVYGGDWARRLCNGCYGRLLSLFEIKAGTGPEDERAEQLAAALVSVVAIDDQHRATALLRASDARATELCSEAVRFIATAEHVATQLDAAPQLEWSPAVIGLCKAVEAEVISRILRPLAATADPTDLSADRSDKDLGRVATFCADPSRKPPELGTFAHFLQTALHSEQRRSTSSLLRSFFKLASTWPGSHWLFDPHGLHFALTSLTTEFRNRAAHIDELSKADYVACRDSVIGSNGALWNLLVATKVQP